MNQKDAIECLGDRGYCCCASCQTRLEELKDGLEEVECYGGDPSCCWCYACQTLMLGEVWEGGQNGGVDDEQRSYYFGRDWDEEERDDIISCVHLLFEN